MSDENDLENNVPLEKTKIKKEIVQESTTPIIKSKKPRTEKQLKQFQQVMTKRQENIEKKKLEKKLEARKLLAQQDPEFFKKLYNQTPTPVYDENDKTVEVVEPKKSKANKKTPTIIELDNDEESDESVIIVKKKAKPKKKKKIIVEQSASEESSSGSDNDVVQLPKPKRSFVSQQNRKSVIKIHNKPNVLAYENYFV